MPPNRDDTTLASDLLRGAEMISKFVGFDRRTTYYLLESGGIPARRLNKKSNKKGVWLASKKVLTEHFRTPTNLTDDTNDTNTEATPRAQPTRRRVARRSARR
jgi:hypothetical protein